MRTSTSPSTTCSAVGLRAMPRSRGPSRATSPRQSPPACAPAARPAPAACRASARAGRPRPGTRAPHVVLLVLVRRVPDAHRPRALVAGQLAGGVRSLELCPRLRPRRCSEACRPSQPGRRGSRRKSSASQSKSRLYIAHNVNAASRRKTCSGSPPLRSPPGSRGSDVVGAAITAPGRTERQPLERHSPCAPGTSASGGPGTYPWLSHSRQKLAVRCIHSYASSVDCEPRCALDQLSDVKADWFSPQRRPRGRQVPLKPNSHARAVHLQAHVTARRPMRSPRCSPRPCTPTHTNDRRSRTGARTPCSGCDQALHAGERDPHHAVVGLVVRRRAAVAIPRALPS